ncbi:DUF4179 domain-containing protein [Cohnella lupini]|uniref:Uncharacterized protein DUF4179 n=1 Tax=Cohnella lupini TaxID=1294267 RepID=A0A3D9IQK8_9BACL|nr:DUF4179 domain-containing protein [Cohnella lupini]RED64022.1 uncharacterized protein DUF4179 [Cohnella lupini]
MKHAEIDQALRTMKMGQTSVVPLAISGRIEQTLHSLPKSKNARNRSSTFRRWVYGGASVAVAGGIILLGTAVYSPKAATELERIPLVGPKLQEASNWGQAMAADFGLASQKVTDNGIAMTLNEVIYDGLRMSIGYSLVTSEGMQTNDMDIELKVDGVRIGYVQSEQSGGIVNGTVNNEVNVAHDDLQLEGNISAILYNYRPPAFELTLEVTRIGDKVGKWSFAVPVEEANDIEVLTPDLGKSKDHMSVKLNEVTFSPLSTVVSLDYSFGFMKKADAVGFELVDDRGIVYNPWIYGNRMSSYSSGTSNSSGIVKLDFPAISDEVKYLIVKPHFYDTSYFSQPNAFSESKDSKDSYNREPLDELPTEQNPIILSQGQAGRLLVTGIEFDKNETIVHYRTEGSNPQVQRLHLNLENEQGELIYPIEEQPSNSDRERTMAFPALSPDSKLNLVTSNVIGLVPIPDMDLRIDLPRS